MLKSISLVLIFLLFIFTGVSYPQNWQFFSGVSRSWPNLRESNVVIHEIERELRQFAPGVSRFEDWHDVYTGSLGIGVAKKMNIGRRPIWPNFSLGWARGDVRSSESRLASILDAPLAYKFVQEYRLWMAEAGVLVPLISWNRLTWKMAGYISWNYLHSLTSLRADAPVKGFSRRVNADFRDTTFGSTLGMTLEYKVIKNISLMLSAKYQWCRFHGYTRVKDMTFFLGTSSVEYREKTLVDTSGPVLGAYLLFDF